MNNWKIYRIIEIIRELVGGKTKSRTGLRAQNSVTILINAYCYYVLISNYVFC